MVKSFVSPGVFSREVDASFLAPGVGAIGAALIGRATKGPAFVPVTVENFSQYVEYFGDLDTDYLLGYAARAYLRNAGTASIVRVLGPAGRSVNGTAVTPGYSADKMYGINAVVTASSDAALMALVELTHSGDESDVVVTDLTSNELYVQITQDGGSTYLIETTASFLTSSDKYIKKVMNTDPTKANTYGYYVRDVYDYAYGITATGDAQYTSASYGLTAFTVGYNSGSTPWLFSQPFGSTEHNLFRFHTLGHGEAENGRFKISINNIRVAANPSVDEHGKFDVEVRTFGDTDSSRNIVESFPNVSMDKTDNLYIARVIGDKYWEYDFSRTKMVEKGTFDNRSKLIRVEMTTGSVPDAALPWGFRGLAKADVSVLSGTVVGFETDTVCMKDLPLVADLKDKKTQAEANKKYYWGMETELSGNVAARFTYLPLLTGSDTDFSLKNVAGTALGFLSYSAGLATAQQKAPGATTANTVLEPAHAKFTVPIAFGFDGFDRRLEDPLNNEAQLLTVAQHGTQALRQGVEIVSDPDFIDINLLAVPGVYSSRVVDFAIDKVEDRADAFYVADISGSTVTAVTQEIKNRGLDSNYVGMYYPDIKVWDDVNNEAKQVPASIAAIGAIAYNDRVGYPWFAPAGLNRAGLSREVIGFDVLNITDQLTKDERDTLYENRLNAIARFPDVPQGVIWGQKTLQIKSSALDRINVRRLLIRAKKLIASAVKFLVFEPANATTMTRFRQLVNPILSDIQQKQGLEAFKVVMDETTTTAELIDRNQLYGKIFLVPTRTAEGISIDFIVSPSGASFDES